MKVVFSEHARNQMLERKISEKKVISTVLNPDKIIKQTQGKFRVVKLIQKNGRKYLMIVIYRQINSVKRVITAFLTTKFKKYFK